MTMLANVDLLNHFRSATRHRNLSHVDICNFVATGSSDKHGGQGCCFPLFFYSRKSFSSPNHHAVCCF